MDKPPSDPSDRKDQKELITSPESDSGILPEIPRELESTPSDTRSSIGTVSPQRDESPQSSQRRSSCSSADLLGIPSGGTSDREMFFTPSSSPIRRIRTHRGIAETYGLSPHTITSSPGLMEVPYVALPEFSSSSENVSDFDDKPITVIPPTRLDTGFEVVPKMVLLPQSESGIVSDSETLVESSDLHISESPSVEDPPIGQATESAGYSYENLSTSPFWQNLKFSPITTGPSTPSMDRQYEISDTSDEPDNKDTQIKRDSTSERSSTIDTELRISGSLPVEGSLKIDSLQRPDTESASASSGNLSASPFWPYICLSPALTGPSTPSTDKEYDISDTSDEPDNKARTTPKIHDTSSEAPSTIFPQLHITESPSGESSLTVDSSKGQDTESAGPSSGISTSQFWQKIGFSPNTTGPSTPCREYEITDSDEPDRKVTKKNYDNASEASGTISPQHPILLDPSTPTIDQEPDISDSVTSEEPSNIDSQDQRPTTSNMAESSDVKAEPTREEIAGDTSLNPDVTITKKSEDPTSSDSFRTAQRRGIAPYSGVVVPSEEPSSFFTSPTESIITCFDERPQKVKEKPADSKRDIFSIVLTSCLQSIGLSEKQRPHSYNRAEEVGLEGLELGKLSTPTKHTERDSSLSDYSRLELQANPQRSPGRRHEDGPKSPKSPKSQKSSKSGQSGQIDQPAQIDQLIQPDQLAKAIQSAQPTHSAQSAQKVHFGKQSKRAQSAQSNVQSQVPESSQSVLPTRSGFSPKALWSRLKTPSEEKKSKKVKDGDDGRSEKSRETSPTDVPTSRRHSEKSPKSPKKDKILYRAKSQGDKPTKSQKFEKSSKDEDETGETETDSEGSINLFGCLRKRHKSKSSSVKSKSGEEKSTEVEGDSEKPSTKKSATGATPKKSEEEKISRIKSKSDEDTCEEAVGQDIGTSEKATETQQEKSLKAKRRLRSRSKSKSDERFEGLVGGEDSTPEDQPEMLPRQKRPSRPWSKSKSVEEKQEGGGDDSTPEGQQEQLPRQKRPPRPQRRSKSVEEKHEAVASGDDDTPEDQSRKSSKQKIRLRSRSKGKSDEDEPEEFKDSDDGTPKKPTGTKPKKKKKKTNIAYYFIKSSKSKKDDDNKDRGGSEVYI